MAVHFSFAASKVHKSVPCVGDSISLIDLKDAIAAPLVVALQGKKLREHFDFRVYDTDTKQEIVGASARVRKNASVLVKRIPAYVLSQQKQRPPVVVSSRGLKVVDKCLETLVDDGFGEDVYSRSSVSRSSVSSEEVADIEIRNSSKKEEARVVDDDCRDGVHPRSTVSVVSKSDAEKVQKESAVSRHKDNEAWRESVSGAVPEELVCTLCKNIMKDPMLIPCCCKSFCQNCIKVVLLAGRKCPGCESSRCTDADLFPNRHLKPIIDVYFKSNPTASSSDGSCPSQTTSEVVVAQQQQQETLHNKASNPHVHVSKSLNGRGVLGKREPLIISLNGGTKRTKV